jgi:acyl-CoA thioesterase-1
LIVAVGASNTAGRGRGAHAGGVNPEQAYPAQLETLLRQRGWRVRVRNAGVAGDTTADMLARLAADAPPGVRIVVLQPGGNDARRGMSGRQERVREIVRRLEAQGAEVLLRERLGSIAPTGTRDPDGMHFNADGHAAIARHLLPQVENGLRRR